MLHKYFLIEKIIFDNFRTDNVKSFIGSVGRCVYVYEGTIRPNIVLSLNDDKNLMVFYKDELREINIE